MMMIGVFVNNSEHSLSSFLFSVHTASAERKKVTKQREILRMWVIRLPNRRSRTIGIGEQKEVVNIPTYGGENRGNVP